MLVVVKYRFQWYQLAHLYQVQALAWLVASMLWLLAPAWISQSVLLAKSDACAQHPAHLHQGFVWQHQCCEAATVAAACVQSHAVWPHLQTTQRVVAIHNQVGAFPY